MVTLSNCKVYLRIDTDFEDKLIEEFISAADLYLKSAITDYRHLYETDEEFEKKADILIKVLVAEMFQNRESRNDMRNDYSYIIRSMMNQLKYYAKEVAGNEDTGDANE